MTSEDNRKNILIVNDDGIQAPGIRVLAEIMKDFGRVYVVAPHTEQSAIGHGITIHDPFRVHHQSGWKPAADAWSLEAKPADCVKFALYALNLPIDLVVSGVNNGPNIGTDIMYSGTMAGASEALLCGVPAIAVSTDVGCFSIVQRYLPGILGQILGQDVADRDNVLNINFPRADHSNAQGVCFTETGFRTFLHDFYEEEENLFWSRGTWGAGEAVSGSDIWAFENGWISVSPIQINRTNYKALERWKQKIKINLHE